MRYMEGYPMAPPEKHVPTEEPIPVGTRVKYVGTFEEFHGPAEIIRTEPDWLVYDGHNNGSTDGKRYTVHTEKGDQHLQWVRRQSLRTYLAPGEPFRHGTTRG
jgi:hypothetical protein